MPATTLSRSKPELGQRPVRHAADAKHAYSAFATLLTSGIQRQQ